MKYKVTAQANCLVTRDDDDNIIKRTARTTGTALKNWRKQLREATDTPDGNILLAAMLNIALGQPERAKIPGEEMYTEWIVPSVSERRQMLQFLWEMDKGKAVAQTEALKAEKETEDVEQYRNISDQQLADVARPFLERLKAKHKELPPAAEDTTSDDE